MDKLNKLFPEIDTYHTGTLKVSDLHTIYYEEAGNPDGNPILFVQGGPGRGIDSRCRQYFDPKFYRIILFDQRGAGKSTPYAELKENTTQHLIQDIEAIRTHLGIDDWVLFGGNWGSTLALLYAFEYPEKVLGLILNGIFLGSQAEINWFIKEGASMFVPDAWGKLIQDIPADKREDLLQTYYEILTSDNEENVLKFAQSWAYWEAAVSQIETELTLFEKFTHPDTAVAHAKIACHFLKNQIFLEEDNYILHHISEKLNKIPCKVIQGRNDIVSPLHTAWKLKEAYPELDLKIVEKTGHGMQEKQVVHELIEATESFKDYYLQGKDKIAVDFDGVLHGYSKGWQDGSIYDNPVPGAREAMLKLKEMGYYVLIFSTRGNATYRKIGKDSKSEMEKWLNKHDIFFDEICTTGKPRAKMYIDDRAINFSGKWDETIETVANFQVWVKKEKA